MPIATGLSPAVMGLARVSRAMDRLDSNTTVSGHERLERLRRTTEYADYSAAEAQSEALDLELHGPDRSVSVDLLLKGLFTLGASPGDIGRTLQRAAALALPLQHGCS